MQDSFVDPSLEALGDLLRQNGFFESLPNASIPLVAHLFEEYAELKTMLSTIKAELLELRDTSTYEQRLLQPIEEDNRRLIEENNALSLRLAELEDALNYKETVPVPPVPAPFPERESPPVYAEHEAMEEELARLREYSKELVEKNSKLEEENNQLKSEVEWTTTESERIVQSLKVGKQNQNTKRELSKSRTLQGTDTPIKNVLGESLANPASSVSALTSEVSHSSGDAEEFTQEHDQYMQTEEDVCYECLAYQEEIAELQHLERSSKSNRVQEFSESEEEHSEEIALENEQILTLQNQIDAYKEEIHEKECAVAELQAELLVIKENSAAHEATAIATTSLSDQLEKKIITLQEEKLNLREELQEKEIQISKHLEDLKETKYEYVKAEKTCKKLANALEDAKARRKLDEGVICRLDKANSTMSGFLSRLGLENERLKRELGIEEGFEPEGEISDEKYHEM